MGLDCGAVARQNGFGRNAGKRRSRLTHEFQSQQYDQIYHYGEELEQEEQCQNGRLRQEEVVAAVVPWQEEQWNGNYETGGPLGHG